MKVFRAVVPAVLLLIAAVAPARDLDSLNIVPADAVSVGMVRLSELRTSPLANRILSQCDDITVDGEADRFLREAGFNPMEDIDAIVFSLSPAQAEERDGDVLLILEGRYDVDRLSRAIEQRGAARVKVQGGSYFRFPTNDRVDHRGAVAVINSRLALAGKESAVVEAIQAISRGGTDFVNAGGLAHLMGRIDQSSSAWLLVDVPRSARLKGEHEFPGNTDRDRALRSALRSVSVVALWADDNGNQLNVGGTAISNDGETLQLLEDLLRGMLATWRLAVQEKSPDLIPTIRKFEVERSGDSVTLSGGIPGDILEKFSKRSRKSYGK